ncbi:MAG: type II toxin-antitoxin system RelE/ParE family toxin [Thiobacillus sp.]
MRSAITQQVKAIEGRKFSVHAAFAGVESGQLRFLGSIYRSAQQLAEQPMMGRARPELAAGLRSFPTQTPYILFHLHDDAGGIIVVRVLHHARDIEAIGLWSTEPR